MPVTSSLSIMSSPCGFLVRLSPLRTFSFSLLWRSSRSFRRSRRRRSSDSVRGGRPSLARSRSRSRSRSVRGLRSFSMMDDSDARRCNWGGLASRLTGLPGPRGGRGGARRGSKGGLLPCTGRVPARIGAALIACRESSGGRISIVFWLRRRRH